MCVRLWRRANTSFWLYSETHRLTYILLVQLVKFLGWITGATLDTLHPLCEAPTHRVTPPSGIVLIPATLALLATAPILGQALAVGVIHGALRGVRVCSKLQVNPSDYNSAAALQRSEGDASCLGEQVMASTAHRAA